MMSIVVSWMTSAELGASKLLEDSVALCGCPVLRMSESPQPKRFEAEGDDRRAVYDTAWNGVRRTGRKIPTSTGLMLVS